LPCLICQGLVKSIARSMTLNFIKQPITLVSALFASFVLTGCTGYNPASTTQQATAKEQSTALSNSAISTHEPGCTVRTDVSKPNPTVESLLSPVTEKDWAKGPGDAFVTILDYSDFQ